MQTKGIGFKNEISIEHLEELTEAMLAQYNNELHSGNSGLRSD